MKVPFPQFRGPWEFLGAEIEQIAEADNGPKMTISHAVALMTVAIEPETLRAALSDEKAKHLATTYADALATNADLSLKMLNSVHSRWHNQTPSDTDLVARFICTQTLVGHGKKRKVLTADAVDQGEISRLIKAWCGRTVYPATIKTVRKRIKLPKAQRAVTVELGQALHHLKSLGFCRY